MTEEEDIPAARRPTVIVGVDGSAVSMHAALVAAWEATVRNAKLEIIPVVQLPLAAEGPGVVDAVSAPETAIRQAVGKAAQAVHEAYPDIDTETEVRYSVSIASELLNAAKGAELLVVGTRGRGGFVGLLLSSVSSQVIHHPPCQVQVVPQERSTREEGDTVEEVAL
jgi:nucleotide-binding universal stress UspA family protein